MMGKRRRKIAVVTGTRADYGLLYWLMHEIRADPALELQVLVTGTHLSPAFGDTRKIIARDGFPITAEIDLRLGTDTPLDLTRSLGLGVIGFGEALAKHRPDVLAVLGDRYEILSAVQAAMMARIPIAHLCGGEATEGVIDEAIRHAITKMAHFHFTAAEPYRRRVIQMGEDPDLVMNFGDPGVENIRRLAIPSRSELEEAIGFPLGNPNFLVTYHPATLDKTGPERAIGELLKALEAFPEARIIITHPNAEVGSDTVALAITRFGKRHPKRVLVAMTLGQRNYLAAMKYSDVVIGNSSSGIIEAPAMGIPTVNLGERQKGRLRAFSVIDCPETVLAITRAVKKALSPRFRREMKNHPENPHGDGDTSILIRDFLKSVDLRGVLYKTFHSLPANVSGQAPVSKDRNRLTRRTGT